MYVKSFIIIILVLLCVYLIYTRILGNKVKFFSKTYNQEFIVNRDSKEQMEASSEALGQIYTMIKSFLICMQKRKYTGWKGEVVDRIYQAYLNNKNFIQEAINEPGSTSFTIEKSEINACLKNRDTNEVYDYNLLIYVIIHELAHVGNTSIGHDESFKKIFKFLQEAAQQCGLYTISDYYNNPQEYCGMTIKSVL